MYLVKRVNDKYKVPIVCNSRMNHRVRSVLLYFFFIGNVYASK